MSTVFITVGSTRFQALTDAALAPSFLSAAARTGVARLVVQAGNAELPPDVVKRLPAGDGAGAAGREFTFREAERSVQVRLMAYTRDAAEMEDLIAAADAVVSHAGSGTILAVLRRASPPRLLVVPNPALMDNHQQELADALHQDGYLERCSVEDLAGAVERLFDASTPGPVPFPAFEPKRFAAILDEVAGFA